MGPDEAVKAFHDLRSDWLVPMHYGTFKLAFEEMDEPPRWLRQLALEQNISHKVRILDEGVPVVF
jgi:L-ascorbate metabolism protein UlaG (beta-lactamase superfamily)